MKEPTLDERIEQGLKDGTVKLISEERIADGKERRRIVDQIRAYKPPASTWWTRSFLRAWLRWIIGLVDDVAKGELFEQLIASNIEELTRLVAGLRADLEATQRALTDETNAHAETHRRLVFYEQHNDSIKPTYAKLRRIDAERAQNEALELARKERAAAKEILFERTSHGELIDCPDCEGRGEVPDEKAKRPNAVKVCDMCHGSGVMPNPEYEPPTEESNGDVSEGDTAFNGPQLVRNESGTAE